MRNLPALALVCFLASPLDAQSTASIADDCAHARANARATSGVLRPDVGLPPHVITWAGSKATQPRRSAPYVRYNVRIDTGGTPLQGTDTVRGVLDRGTADRIRADMRKNVYAPATIGNCRVEGTLVIVMEFGADRKLKFRAADNTPIADSIAARCAEERRRFAQRPAGHTAADTLYPPAPRSLIVPPMPIPASLKGASARFTATYDLDGWAHPGSMRLEGINDRRYARQLLELMLHQRYRPGMFNGCPVEANSLIEFQM